MAPPDRRMEFLTMHQDNESSYLERISNGARAIASATVNRGLLGPTGHGATADERTVAVLLGKGSDDALVAKGPSSEHKP
jgi:hypothetical protein